MRKSLKYQQNVIKLEKIGYTNKYFTYLITTVNVGFITILI